MPTPQNPDLHAWFKRAVENDAEAWALDEYLSQHPEALACLPDDERWGLERAWINIFRRLTGGISKV